jgi:penicillin-binding protein 2
MWGKWKFGDTERGLALQTIAGELGFGKHTGIEIGDAAGRIPDPGWKTAYANANYQKGSPEWVDHSTWYPADNIHAAIGQGDDLVTPLQLANAYACFANGGTLWTPHVEGSVTDPSTKKTISTYTPKALGTVAIDPYTRAQMEAGFLGVTSNPKGTAYDAFRGLFASVSGKTGTADVAGKGATSLFAAYTPSVNPQYAVVAVVEQGGHGAQIAAPIVRQVIETIDGIKPVTSIPTGNHTNAKD